MNILQSSPGGGVLDRPYSFVRSKLGATTKIFTDRYIFDLESVKEIITAIGEKLHALNPKETPTIAVLLSFSDQTHQDGGTIDLNGQNFIPIGKQTERVVIRWVVKHDIDGVENELSITLRVSNPINPLVLLQAALSKNPSDIDNIEFEMGSTCVTVDGAGIWYADEVFYRIKSWIDARRKLHRFIEGGRFYARYEWWIDQLSVSLLPLSSIAVLSLFAANFLSQSQMITAIPPLLGIFFLIQSFGRRINSKMAVWAKLSDFVSIFEITNGDRDAVLKNAAKAKNGFIKLAFTGAINLFLNVVGGIVCWWLLGP